MSIPEMHGAPFQLWCLPLLWINLFLLANARSGFRKPP